MVVAGPGVKNHLTSALSPEGGEGVQPVSPVNENIWMGRVKRLLTIDNELDGGGALGILFVHVAFQER